MLAINETTRRGWTTEETTRLADLWRNNATNEAIAAALGRSVSSIKSRAASMRLGQRDITVTVRSMSDGKTYWTEAEDKQLLELRRRGVRWGKIAEAIGRSPGAAFCRHQKITDSKPKPAITAIRQCMRCTQSFASEGRGNRLCYSCNAYAVECRGQYD